MPYEAFSYCLRVKSHEQIKQATQNSPIAVLAGPAAGMFSQLAMHLEFVRSIKNQTKSEMQSIVLKRFDALGLVALRGALLGLCHLTVEDLCLGFLEQDLDPLGTRVSNIDAQTANFLSKQIDTSESS
jgi:hypothetical protein